MTHIRELLAEWQQIPWVREGMRTEGEQMKTETWYEVRYRTRHGKAMGERFEHFGGSRARQMQLNALVVTMANSIAELWRVTLGPGGARTEVQL